MLMLMSAISERGSQCGAAPARAAGRFRRAEQTLSSLELDMHVNLQTAVRSDEYIVSSLHSRPTPVA
jgi:hypothetical protein